MFDQVKARLDRIDQERKVGIYRNSQSHFLYGFVFCSECGLPFRKGDSNEHKGTMYQYWVCSGKMRKDKKNNACTSRLIKIEELLKTVSEALGLPWHSVKKFDSDVLADAVERIVIKPDGIDVVMKYREATNG